MCNVYAMYSYEPYNSDHQKVFAPLGGCWENQNSALAKYVDLFKLAASTFRFAHMTLSFTEIFYFSPMLASLIPVDAENPPKSPTEMSGRSDETHKHTEHGMGFTNGNISSFFSLNND